MLRIEVPSCEFYDESKEEFLTIKGQTLVMEHSLISISKWEAKWKKSYFSEEKKTTAEILDYLRCMTISPQNVHPSLYLALSSSQLEEISNYINDPMTATTINQIPGRRGRNELLTSELVYYYMIAQNIPVEFEKWHINRLLTLIRVCSIKNDPKQKKMSPSEIRRQNRAINAARRKRLGTKG